MRLFGRRARSLARCGASCEFIDRPTLPLSLRLSLSLSLGRVERKRHPFSSFCFCSTLFLLCFTVVSRTPSRSELDKSTQLGCQRCAQTPTASNRFRPSIPSLSSGEKDIYFVFWRIFPPRLAPFGGTERSRIKRSMPHFQLDDELTSATYQIDCRLASTADLSIMEIVFHLFFPLFFFLLRWTNDGHDR